MPNGKDFAEDLQFESDLKQAAEKGLPELVMFNARQTREMCKKVQNHEERITEQERAGKKGLIAGTGVSGLITAIVIGLTEYFSRK